MSQISLARRAFLGAMFSAGSLCSAGLLLGDEPIAPDQLQKPLFRVGKNNQEKANPPGDEHPLDPALRMANDALKHIREDVTDYTCTLVKRERVNGTLRDAEYMGAKIRNRKLDNGELKTPFSVYMYFLKPAAVKGREALYIEGQNSDKMLAHEGSGVLGKLPSMWLNPTGLLAMKDNLYPITEVGIENLIVRLLEKGNRDRKRDECIVEFRKNATINKRNCTMLQVIHPVKRAYFDFNLAQVFIDNELNVPIRYAAYQWPAGKDTNETPTPSDDTVIEEYTYLNMKINVGLTSKDFDPNNADYNFGKIVAKKEG